MRIVFLGSPDVVIGPLKKLYMNCQEFGHELVGVVSQPAKKVGRKGIITDPPVASFAKENGIKVLQPMTARDPEFLQEFSDLKPDVAITAAYGQILNQEFLDIPTRATINIHPSLIPEYRGATPVQSALLNGDKKTGVTILFTVRALDAGAIICQKDLTIKENDTSKNLLPELFELGGELIFDALKLLDDSSFEGTTQDENLVTHCQKFEKSDGKINFNTDGETIFNKYRAFDPWPGIYYESQSLRFQLTKISLASDFERKLSPGELFYDKPKKRLFVGTKTSPIEILSSKPSGKAEQSADVFFNTLKSRGIKNLEANCG